MVYKQISYSRFCELFTFEENTFKDINGNSIGEDPNAKVVDVTYPSHSPLFGGYKTQIITAFGFSGIAAYEIEIVKDHSFDHFNYYVSKEYLMDLLLSSSASADYDD